MGSDLLLVSDDDRSAVRAMGQLLEFAGLAVLAEAVAPLGSIVDRLTTRQTV